MKTDLTTEPLISIIIPTRDNMADLTDCLNSVLRLECDLSKTEILIWDNHSKPDNKIQFKRFLDRLREESDASIQFIEQSQNHGVYTSRDELLSLVHPGTDFILSIDDDVILPPHLLAEWIPLFQRDSTIGVIGPRIVYDDNPRETAHGAGYIDWLVGRYRTMDTFRPTACDYVIGCCMMIRKSVIDRIGGFDRDYYTSHGEVDFCVRTREKGYKVIYYPSIAVRHRVDRGGTHTLERLYYVYRNKLLVIRKNAPLPQKWIALGFYSLFWLPKGLVDSFIRKRGIDFSEIRMIIKAVLHGWIGRVGKQP
jgi:GT2 family glycosyltransferase